MNKKYKIILLSLLMLASCTTSEKSSDQDEKAPTQGSSEVTTPQEAPPFITE